MIRACIITRAGALAVAAAALAVSLPAASEALPFDVAHRIGMPEGQPVSALAFTPDGKLAYAAAGDEVHGFDVGTGEPVAVIKVPGQVAGLAVSADAGGSLYVAVSAPARLVFLSLHPLRIRSSVSLRGGAPSGLIYVQGEHALYVESRAGHSVARLDADGGKTLAVAHLQGDPEQMAADGHGTVYVANSATDTVDVLATGKMTPSGAIPTPGCRTPTGLALDPVGRRLFVACSNGMALVIDTDMGFAFQHLPIRQGTALQTVFALHPKGFGGWKGGAFIAGDAPELDVIRMNAFISYASAGSMPLSERVTAMAVSVAAGQLWIALAPRDGAAVPEGSGDDAVQRTGVEILALGASGGAK